MLTIISGGQTGADEAGLEAARQLAIPTSGWAPKNFQTSIGPNEYLLKDIYNLKDSGLGYKARTFLNVKDSDATIRCCVDFNSAGEICTLKAINKYNKQYFDIHLLNQPAYELCTNWILNNNIQILNIAGNTQGKHGFDVYSLTGYYIYNVLNLYLEKIKQLKTHKG